MHGLYPNISSRKNCWIYFVPANSLFSWKPTGPLLTLVKLTCDFYTILTDLWSIPVIHFLLTQIQKAVNVILENQEAFEILYNAIKPYVIFSNSAVFYNILKSIETP